MIPQLDIARAGASPADAPWIDGAGARPTSRTVKFVLLGLALSAAAILFAASNDRLARFVEARLAAWTAEPTEMARTAQKRAIARLIAETETDAALPAAEGDDAIARNALQLGLAGDALFQSVSHGNERRVFCALQLVLCE